MTLPAYERRDLAPRSGKPLRFVLICLFASAALAVGGVLLLDGAVLAGLGWQDRAPAILDRFVAFADVVALRGISDFLIGGVLLLAGAVLYLLGRRPLARAFGFVAGVHLTAYLAADLAKPLFGRLRPFQAIDPSGWHDRWFAGSGYGSFPSGHVAFYGGLMVPLALLYPRAAPLLLAVPALVSVERIIALDHYSSDVAASFALILLCCVAFGKLTGQFQHGDLLSTNVSGG